MHRSILVCSLLLAACGPANTDNHPDAANTGGPDGGALDAGATPVGPFEGLFSGKLEEKLDCPMTTYFKDIDSNWGPTVSGSTLQFDMGTCQGVTATIEGDRATVQKHTCPMENSSTLEITGGTLTVSDAELVVDLLISSTDPAETCPGSRKGKLARLP